MPRGDYEDSELIAAAQETMRSSDDAHQLKRAQSILLSHHSGLTLAQIALVLQTSEISVVRWRKEFLLFFRDGIDRRQNWGGVRGRNLSDAQEEALLKRLEPQALKGGILTVGPIQEAYEKLIGRTVRRSVIYEMLNRHGWRKVAPRHKHPKEDALKQEEWKKKPSTGSSRSRRLWMPPKDAT